VEKELVSCPDCDGQGRLWRVVCPDCFGHGYITVPANKGWDNDKELKCEKCHGRGYWYEKLDSEEKGK
jgi:excinuclease UvrABC ATPase subunit